MNATTLGPACLQIARNPPTLSFKLIGNEDCLFLNVYTPSTSQIPNLYPVLVFIHGGSFNQGRASLDPQRLVTRGIVVVTIQYRIGVFGFLSSGDRDLPGNFGLLDQRLALQWVQQNIHEFSGDSKRVTLAGLSAGGASVTFHMVSPGSRGLFHQAIATSGVFLNPWALHTGDHEKVRAVARYVGCTSSPDAPIAALLPCLRLADANKLVEATQQFYGWRKSPFSILGPVIDRNFISEDPYKLLKDGNVARIPLLLSCTTAEGNFIVSGEFTKV